MTVHKNVAQLVKRPFASFTKSIIILPQNAIICHVT